MKHASVQRISPERFARFGSVAQTPGENPTAKTAGFSYWSDIAHYHIDGETEIGYCTVYQPDLPRVTWFERHDRTPEVLVPIDAPFILPVMDEDGEVAAFRAEPGEAVVIGTGVWHSACLPVGRKQATYFVVFRRGTPAEDVTKRDVDAVHLTL